MSFNIGVRAEGAIFERFETTAWVLGAYENASSAGMMRQSKTHLVDPKTGEILCGAHQRMHFAYGEGGCKRCLRRAQRILSDERPPTT